MDSDDEIRFPLTWPIGWHRTAAPKRTSAKFGDRATGAWRNLTIASGVARIVNELKKLGVHEDRIIISTNVRPTLSGVPRSSDPAPADPGVAVYWTQKGKRQCIAVDRYVEVAGNLGAIAATLDAMRAIERHGGAEILDRAFTGFTALPSPEQPWQVLGLETSRPTRAQVDDAYRKLAAQHHPDRGGMGDRMARINRARDALYGQL